MTFFPGEQEAILTVKDLGRKYGFGNLIQHLRVAWYEALMERKEFDAASARQGAGLDDVSPIDVKRLKTLLGEALPCVESAEALCRRHGGASGADYKGNLAERIGAALSEVADSKPEQFTVGGVDIRKFSLEDLRNKADEIDAALARTKTLDLSEADLIIIRSTSNEFSGIDQLLACEIAAHVKAKYDRRCVVVVLRPAESIEALDEAASRKLYDHLKERFGKR